MYKLHLILKYLRKRRIAWVSLIAVMLCTAMVLIVISVMGGWLRMFRASFHGLDGDVIVRAGSAAVGFPYYEEMIDGIEKLPEVGVGNACPMIETFGLINIINQRRQGVQVIGYPLDKIGNVNNFPQSLYRQYQARNALIEQRLQEPGLSDADRAKLTKELSAPPHPTFDLVPGVDYESIARNYGFNNPKTRPGMIAGAGLVDVRKEADGKIHRPDFEYELWARLTVMPIDPDVSQVRPEDRVEQIYWIVDDSRTQVYQRDSATVYVSFDYIQNQLAMNRYEYKDKDTAQTRVSPARTTEIQIKVKPGFDLNEAKKKIDAIVRDVESKHDIDMRFPNRVETWEESQAVYLNAIENEKTLVTMLFGIISLVAVMLILCIFYMIVMEKTRDIGIIKSVGATSSGVAGIFLGYGAAIGVVGAGLGFVAGYLIVHNINELHSKFAQITGRPIWDPQVYAFDTIPNTMNPHEVLFILAVAVVASVLGAVVPAIAAARLNPVESLRWE